MLSYFIQGTIWINECIKSGTNRWEHREATSWQHKENRKQRMSVLDEQKVWAIDRAVRLSHQERREILLHVSVSSRAGSFPVYGSISTCIGSAWLARMGIASIGFTFIKFFQLNWNNAFRRCLRQRKCVPSRFMPFMF